MKPSVRTNFWKWTRVVLQDGVQSPLLAFLNSVLVLFPPVFNLLLFFDLCPTHPPCFSLLHFPSFPHAFHLSFLPAPSSHHPPSSLFFFPLLVSTHRLPSHAFFFHFTSPPPPPRRPHPMLLPSYAACTHASPWPPCLHPLLNYSWESSPVSGGLCREERRRVQRQ